MFVQHYAPNHMPATKGFVNVTAGLKPANLSQELLAGTLPDLHLYIFEAGSMADYMLVTLT